MSVVIERLIFCDECSYNKSGDDRNYLTIKEMRTTRKAEGWVQRGSKDYCSDCAQLKPWLNN